MGQVWDELGLVSVCTCLEAPVIVLVEIVGLRRRAKEIHEYSGTWMRPWVQKVMSEWDGK